MQNIFIRLSKIKLEYDSKVILDNFSASINTGDIVVIIGKSGIGKSSILNMLMGFVKPAKGHIEFGGIELNAHNIRNIRRRISWLPQEASSIGQGSALETIMHPFNFAVNRKNRPSINEIINSLELLNLDKSILDNSFDKLSGGEKQRIGLIIAKLLRKPLIMLDEPTSALDKSTIGLVAEYILGDNNSTVISVSHEDEWISRCNSRIELI